MSFTAVVVIHDSRADLARLLASLEAHVDPAPQVIVVDSGSADDGAALARAHGAQVVELDGNRGFGAANNAGVALAAHETTVLLNPDVIAADNGLTALAALPAQRDALYAPRLRNADGSLQRSAHPLPGTWSALLPALVHPRALWPSARLRADPWRAGEARPVGWAIAACLAARTSTLRALGPFDPGVFLYGEDMDLCLRARAQGVPTILRPEVDLVHTGGTSAAAHFGEEPLELKARRRREVVEADLGRGALRLDDTAQGLTFATRALARRLTGRDARRTTGELHALRAARRGGKRPPGA